MLCVIADLRRLRRVFYRTYNCAAISRLRKSGLDRFEDLCVLVMFVSVVLSSPMKLNARAKAIDLFLTWLDLIFPDSTNIKVTKKKKKKSVPQVTNSHNLCLQG